LYKRTPACVIKHYEMKRKTVNSEILVGYVSSTPAVKVFCAQWELKKCRNI
jgi:hypothetical protein